MMKTKTAFFRVLLLTVAAAAPLFAQNTQSVESEKAATQSAETAARQEKIVAALKNIGREAGALNVAENRVRYLTEAGDLLWQHDDKTARTHYANAFNDFRVVLQSLDAEAQQREGGEAEETISFFGGSRSGYRSVYQISTLRRNLLLSLAKYDPQTAHDFFHETARENLKSHGWNDGDLETQLISLIAKNDPAHALALGQQKLAKTEFDGLPTLMMNLYGKDTEKGAKLAAALVGKLRSTPLDASGLNRWFVATSLYVQAAEILEKPDTGKQPLLSKSELNELGDLLIKKMLDGRQNINTFGYNQHENFNKYLAKYSPAAHSAMEREIKLAMSKLKTEDDDDVITTVSPEDANRLAQLEEAASEMRGGGSGTGVGSGVGRGSTAAVISDESIQKSATDELNKMSVADIRKKLAAVKGRMARFVAAGQIIKTLADNNQTETARQLLPEIAEFQTLQPRKASEVMMNLYCADALAGIDPSRSFGLLENTLLELNGVAGTFLRLGEFFEAKEIAENNEFNMGGFPREFLRGEFGLSIPQMLQKLAKADFERTMTLPDKIERPEMRLEAKMLVVRSLLEIKTAPSGY